MSRALRFLLALSAVLLAQLGPAIAGWNYRIGEWVRVRLGRTPQKPVRFRCGSVERTLPAGDRLEFVAPSPGGLRLFAAGWRPYA